MSRASTSWEKANLSYQNYHTYICRKPDRFALSFIDLLYVRNFKAGNASIHEAEDGVNTKLIGYSSQLKRIHDRFGERHLKDLSNEELEMLKKYVCKLLQFTSDADFRIDGFKASYASALIHFHFPDLIPILDRRVLNGTGVRTVREREQVEEIEQYYPALMDNFYNYLRQHPEKLIRDYDKASFIKPLEGEATAGA